MINDTMKSDKMIGIIQPGTYIKNNIPELRLDVGKIIPLEKLKMVDF